jgi:transposase InsO family protein
MAESRLARDGRSGTRAQAAGIRRRDGNEYSISPLYAWSKRGERACLTVPRNRTPNTRLLASMTAEGIGPCMAVEGAITRVVFEAYIERMLTPALRPGQVAVMDNLATYKSGRVQKLIEERGCELLYLRAYSPDLNPIKQAFSKIKGILRKGEVRTGGA